jgi:hypothetical protein
MLPLHKMRRDKIFRTSKPYTQTSSSSVSSTRSTPAIPIQPCRLNSSRPSNGMPSFVLHTNSKTSQPRPCHLQSHSSTQPKYPPLAVGAIYPTSSDQHLAPNIPKQRSREDYRYHISSPILNRNDFIQSTPQTRIRPIQRWMHRNRHDLPHQPRRRISNYRLQIPRILHQTHNPLLP